MKVVILCGGMGTRMGETTIPKALARVGEKPIIEHIMDHYARYGLVDFILPLGFMGDQIKNYFLNKGDLTIRNDGTIVKHNHGNYNITFCDTGISTLPGERLLRCSKYITDDFCLTYCDGVAPDLNIKKLLDYHRASNRIGTITVTRPHSKFGMVTLDFGRVSAFQEKPVLDSTINAGFMVFKKDFLSYVWEGEMEHDGLKRLIAVDQLGGYEYDGFWMAVDTKKELEELNNYYKEFGFVDKTQPSQKS